MYTHTYVHAHRHTLTFVLCSLGNGHPGLKQVLLQGLAWHSWQDCEHLGSVTIGSQHSIKHVAWWERLGLDGKILL